jgi:putative radical SAM enzyme (TIGR03279 family)
MSAKICSVDDGSIASQLGLQSGDTLVAINGNEINDVIDYMFHSENEELDIEAVCDGENVIFEIEKDAQEPLGINFETYLIDSQRCCKNKCIFCFIDQLPKGLRETMYFKDDDARLSFLMGNYITLTNLSDSDVERICKMRISPINVSVHTTDPELRVKMMKNPNAALINERLETFAKAGITMNCQMVLCKGVNDGQNLIKTLNDLEALYPNVNSVSIVPVGITKFRDGLYPLVPFEKEDCKEVVAIIDKIGDRCKKNFGVRLFYPSDEFFIKGDLPVPDEDYYDGYPQIENGVGLCASLLTEVELAMKNIEYSDSECSCGIITGVLPAFIMQKAVDIIRQKRPKLDCKIYPIVNNFFGDKITVAGLVTATDIIDQLKDMELPENLFIPSSMLRAEQDMFLDSITLEKVEKTLKRNIGVCYNDGYDLVSKILGERMDDYV